ncbi:hypothetical protein D3P08_00450 [Paenibacillus nanensis]|uniref:Immunity protein 30 domain-containing protein n=1 Tax=Paenibacillus nanensis TaxID=393251 RepID=A0A3A1VGS3_9BACL|nr:hypothetical protein [Paenibacillus nanensis]RIX60098.1 hypothetical protein D3P08_00450 [Paenibacillus nanensis]
MYEELDEYLSGYFTEDYWYDEGFSIAREILERFNNIDWEKLQENILSKPIDWQIRYAYCVDSDINDEVIIQSLILLSSIDDNELFTTCVDSLRVMVNPNNKANVSSNKPIMERIEKMLPECGAATKKVLEDFIRKIQN